MNKSTINRLHKSPPYIVLLAGLFFSPVIIAQISLDPDATCTSSSCHVGIGEEGNNHLFTNMGQSCQFCHKAPDSTAHKFQPATPGGETCKQCHANLIDKEYKHVPAAAGMCTSCHRIHEAKHPKQLLIAPENLCKTCHSQTATADTFSRHLPAVQGECVQCHDPHSSNHKKQLKSAVPELCFGCHNQPQQDEEGYVIPPVEPLYLDDSLNKHPSFGRGECLLCHNPHGSENYRLQKGNYPKSLYADFSTTRYFCFNCHDSNAFTEGRTLTATEFRNGDMNLHFRHVNREKGRSCRACHHHHASDRDALVTHEVPFGDRSIAINEFETTETGGTCSATCHLSMRYDRVTPAVNNLAVTPFELVAEAPVLQQPSVVVPDSGKKVFQSRCSGCHGDDAQGGLGGMAPSLSGATAVKISNAIATVPMMAAVADVEASDIEAIAGYLSGLATADPAETNANGEALFAAQCAGCHGVGGLGGIASAITGTTEDRIKNGISTVPMMEQLKHLIDAELIDIAQFLQSQGNL